MMGMNDVFPLSFTCREISSVGIPTGTSHIVLIRCSDIEVPPSPAHLRGNVSGTCRSTWYPERKKSPPSVGEEVPTNNRK